MFERFSYFISFSTVLSRKPSGEKKPMKTSTGPHHLENLENNLRSIGDFFPRTSSLEMFMCMLLEMLIYNRRFWLSIQRKNHMFVKEVVSIIVKYTYKIGI